MNNDTINNSSIDLSKEIYNTTKINLELNTTNRSSNNIIKTDYSTNIIKDNITKSFINIISSNNSITIDNEKYNLTLFQLDNNTDFFKIESNCRNNISTYLINQIEPDIIYISYLSLKSNKQTFDIYYNLYSKSGQLINITQICGNQTKISEMKII